MSHSQNSTVPPDFATLNANTTFLLLGIYGWEYLQSFQIECALIRGQSTFRSSVIPYILGRACLLSFLILLAAGTILYGKGIACLAGALAAATLGDIALGCSSMNFLIRTWMIWKDYRLVRVLLLLLALAQWTVLMVDLVNIRAIDRGCICDVYLVYPQMNAVALIYTMFLDLFVFVLSVVGLSNQRSDSPLTRRLRAQGTLYIALAGITYIPAVVSALLANIAIYVIVSNAAITVSTIVSSRSVRSLHALDTCTPSETLESSVALTTHIAMHQSRTEIS